MGPSTMKLILFVLELNFSTLSYVIEILRIQFNEEKNLVIRIGIINIFLLSNINLVYFHLIFHFVCCVVTINKSRP